MPLIEKAVELLQRTASQKPVAAVSETNRLATDRMPSSTDDPLTTEAAEASLLPHRHDRIVRVDLSALRAAGLVPPESEERQLAAEYRHIKRPLLSAMASDSRPRLTNVIVVTSALPGEGKTFTAINLALSLSLELAREVVLIDGDVAKAQITELFELKGAPGLLDLAATNIGLEDAIVRSDVPSLYVMPAGNGHADATEILRSERIASMIADVAVDPRRILVIDAPPLLVTSEASVVVTLAGQAILVVNAGVTPQEAVVRAIETFAEEMPLSLVLNQADTVRAQGYGAYGRYGHYGSTGDASAKRDGVAVRT